MSTPVTSRSSQKNTPGGILFPANLIDAYPDMCFVVSSDGIIEQINSLVERLLGVESDRLYGTPMVSWIEPSLRERFLSEFNACLQTRSRQNHESELVSSGGEPVSVILQLSPIVWSDQEQKSGILIVARDIGESKRLELELLRFANVAHYTVNPLEITDPSGKIIYVNPAFERASGYTKEEILGKNPNLFGSGKHPKSFWQKMWKTINSGNVWTGEVENRRRNGEPFYTQLLISPIIDGSGTITGYFGVHRDITEQRKLEQQLIHAQKMESIGLLAAGIAHEVGNPLTSISSLVQIIQRTTTDEFTHEKLELIKSQITRISRIIRDLVDFSRRSSYEVKLTDINKSITEAVEIVRVGKKAKNILFQTQLNPNLPPLPLVPDQIEQVVINILINAVDAVHANSDTEQGKRQGTVAISSDLSDTDVVVTIQDNGKGISEQSLPKIFEPFFTTKKVGEGTGLGLWVSYGIIKSFQGTITVESSEGEGATFTILLPIHVKT